MCSQINVFSFFSFFLSLYWEGISRSMRSYKEKLAHYKITSLEVRRNYFDLIFLYKILRYEIDCPQILENIMIRAPRRYPRTPITPFCPPFRKTVLGANSPICRMCKLLNDHSDLIDIYIDSAERLRKIFLTFASDSCPTKWGMVRFICFGCVLYFLAFVFFFCTLNVKILLCSVFVFPFSV
jgi:hypothetical protein